MKHLLVSIIIYLILDAWSRKQNEKVFATKADLARLVASGTTLKVVDNGLYISDLEARLRALESSPYA